MRASTARLLIFISNMALVLGLVALPSWQHWILKPRAQPGIYFEYVDFILYATDLLLITGILAGFGGRFLAQQSIDLGPFFITGPLVILIAWSGLSVWWALDKPLAAYQTLRLTLFLGYYLVWAQADAPWRVAAWALLLSAVVQGSVGLGQFIKQGSLGLRSLGEIPLAPIHGFSILHAAGRDWLRAYGLTQHPNVLGGVLAVSILLAMREYWAGRAYRQVWLIGLWCIGLGGLVVSFSRSAWLGYGAGVIAMLALTLVGDQGSKYYRKARQGLILACAAVLAVSVIFLGPIVISRLAGRTNPLETRSIDERVLGTREGIEMVLAHPLFGIGQANYPVVRQAATLVQHPEYGSIVPQQIHTVPLLVASELGLGGAALWLYASLAPLAVFATARSHWQMVSPELIAATGALVAVFIIGLFDYYPWLLQQGRLIQWLAWGLWANAWSHQTSCIRLG